MKTKHEILDKIEKLQKDFEKSIIYTKELCNNPDSEVNEIIAAREFGNRILSEIHSLWWVLE